MTDLEINGNDWLEMQYVVYKDIPFYTFHKFHANNGKCKHIPVCLTMWLLSESLVWVEFGPPLKTR